MLTDVVDKGVRQLVVDLGGVDYVSSPGVAAIEEVEKRLDAVRGALVLSDLAEPVRIAFSLAGASLPVEPSRESAIAYLSRPTSRFFP